MIAHDARPLDGSKKRAFAMPALGPADDAKQAGPATTADLGAQAAGSQRTEACGLTRRAKLVKAVLAALVRRRRLLVAVVFFLGLIAAGVALALPHVRAWYHFREAKSALQSYHNPQAVRHLQACLHTWPDDPDVLLLSARAARRARAYDEAERCLEKYWQARGLDDAYSLEQLLLSAERDVDQVALVCRRRVEQDDPDAPLILEALTRGYLRQYRLGEAHFCLDLWLRTQPDNPQALCFEGEFHLDYEHAPDRAAKSYRRAVELDPEHEQARLGLAIVLLETKSFLEAAEHLEYLRRCQPDNLRVQVGLAECHYYRAERDEAERLVNDVLAQQADYAPALSLRGRLAVASGQYAEAEPWLRRAVARAPNDHQARYNLILCLGNNGKGGEAKRYAQELQQWEEDLKRFNEIVTQEMPKRPDDPALLCELGQLLLRSGHKEEGLRWLRSALRLDPQNAAARQALADYYEKAQTKQVQPDQ
jgi:tetratricopeptide (TPR) repeat protein